MRPLKMVSLWNALATYNRFKESRQPSPRTKAAREAASVEQDVMPPLIRQYPK
jgi:hypothetical protein